MTTYYAQLSNNIDAANVWNTSADGSGTYVPYSALVAGDILIANGRIVTVNINTDLGGTGRVVTTGSAGHFLLADGVSLRADAYAGPWSEVVKYSGSYPNSATLNGKVVASNGGTSAAQNTGTGTLNINGDVTGGGWNHTHGALNSGSGVLNITGTVTGGLTNNSHGAYNSSNGQINIIGDVVATGQPGATNADGGTITIEGNVITTGGHHGVWNLGSGNIVVNGDVTASAAGVPANNAGSGSVTINGTVTAADANPAAITSSTGPIIVNGSLVSAANGRFPVSGLLKVTSDTSVVLYSQESDLLTFGDVGALAESFPSPEDVRYGTTYGGGEYTGTCAVPAASSVAEGVPVDDTVGTAFISAENIRAALGLAAANLDTKFSDIPLGVRTELAPELERVSNCATVQSTGDQIAAAA
jgi:hypothetical protein